MDVMEEAYYETVTNSGIVREVHFNYDTSRGILVFLPGHDEIIEVANLLYDALDVNCEIFILHSQMKHSMQHMKSSNIQCSHVSFEPPSAVDQQGIREAAKGPGWSLSKWFHHPALLA